MHLDLGNPFRFSFVDCPSNPALPVAEPSNAGMVSICYIESVLGFYLDHLFFQVVLSFCVLMGIWKQASLNINIHLTLCKLPGFAK